MTREIIQTNTKEEWKKLRSLDITSTEMAALFGLSPYMTEFELFHNKKNSTVVEIEENERMKWGNRLESAIAQGVLEDLGGQGRPMKEYIRLSDLRLGASFDWRIHHGDRPLTVGVSDETQDTETDGLLEIKNVDALMFRDGWLVDEDGNVEAPPHIEIQVQQQMLVSGLKWARIAALVGGNTVALIERKFDEEVASAIVDKAEEFWTRVDENNAPDPDFVKDSDFIRQLYKFATPGTVMDVSQDEQWTTLAQAYKSLAEQIKAAEEQRAGLKSQMLMALGEAEKAVGDGFTISAGLIGPCEMAYTREGYRNFRINWPRKKK